MLKWGNNTPWKILYKTIENLAVDEEACNSMGEKGDVYYNMQDCRPTIKYKLHEFAGMTYDSQHILLQYLLP